MPNYRQVARQDAVKYGLNPTIFARQINQESGFNPNARSPAGAIGIAQIMPQYHPSVDPTDPVASLDYAAKWMSQLVKQYGGSYAKALSVYNSGKPDAYLDKSFSNGQTYNYVRTILGNSHPDLTAPAQPAGGLTALGGGAGRDVLAQGVTEAQQGAADIRSQARQNLHDIAMGTVQPTEALAKLPGLQQGGDTAPVVFAPPNMQSGSLEAKAVALAKKYIGVKYTWGGESIATGFDCSGLVQNIWKTLGVNNVPRTTYAQWDSGTSVDSSSLAPGDAVFFTGSDPQNGKPGHEGLYIGNGKFIEAPGSGKTVRISTLAGRSDYVGARRFG